MIPELRNRIRGKRLVIIGVGNSLRGDDGVGPALVERLQGKTSATLIDASDVPENYLGLVAQAQPQVVVIVDAVELGASPGDLALIEAAQLGGAKATTHNTSLAPFVQILQADTGADIFLLAIQPRATLFGEGLSAPVRVTLERLEQVFIELA
mgnify:CR=1 FL=1